MSDEDPDVVWLEDVGSGDVGSVGGKNASLGEMIQSLGDRGIRVPGGFATTAAAYRRHLELNELTGPIREQLEGIDSGGDPGRAAGAIRELIVGAELPPRVTEAIRSAYGELAGRLGRSDPDVAVRSSATAEDLPEASFAGQQDTYLNICGIDPLLDAIRRCFASLFTDRAISYRANRGFDHMEVALSVCIQEMVRSDTAGAGVMFTIDTDTGFPEVIMVDSAWGLGESVVSGQVDPDEHLVYKPTLHDEDLDPVLSSRIGAKRTKIVYASADGDAPASAATTRTIDTSAAERDSSVLDHDEVVQLARWASVIEDHYGRPMDIEWAKDGNTGQMFIVQARPETVQSNVDDASLESYTLEETGPVLVTGLAVGEAVATGEVCRLDDATEIDQFRDGSILVTAITDPDWEPIMKRAVAIVTDHGGRTSHAAIVSRELGLPAVIGTGDATTELVDEQEVTVSCAGGDTGTIYEGILEHRVEKISLSEIQPTQTRVMLNMADPTMSFRWWRLPADGVGLARMEFIVNNHIGIHPLALLGFSDLDDDEVVARIERRTQGFEDKAEFFVTQLASGIARIAATWSPKPVILRMSDFKTNEYASLIGGGGFEPREANPMIGWRGASRYYHPDYRDGFALECAAVHRVRDVMGLTNVVVMIPFCRILEEADDVLEVLAENDLVRGRNGLEVYMMAEVPSNVIMAADFAERFDGFSIGSNDLTQLTLGVDRDSARLADLFDECNPAVTRSIESLISDAHAARRKVGLCGQRPSDDPDFAGFLVGAGIDSISVTPDAFLRVKDNVAMAEGTRSGS